MSQSAELQEMEELQRVEERTTRDGKREVEILDWERTDNGTIVEMELLTQPDMAVETIEMEWPETKSPRYRFVRIVNGLGYTLDDAHRIKGKTLMATVDEDNNWSLDVPDRDVPAHVQQRADQIRDAYASLRSRLFGAQLSLTLPLSSDVEVDAGKPFRTAGQWLSIVASTLMYLAVLPLRLAEKVWRPVRTALLVAHVLFPYRKVRKGVEACAAMVTGVGLGTAIVLLIVLSLYSSMQGRDEAFALSDKWFARFFGIGAIIKFPALAAYILLYA